MKIRTDLRVVHSSTRTKLPGLLPDGMIVEVIKILFADVDAMTITQMRQCCEILREDSATFNVAGADSLKTIHRKLDARQAGNQKSIGYVSFGTECGWRKLL